MGNTKLMKLEFLFDYFFIVLTRFLQNECILFSAVSETRKRSTTL